MPDTPDPPDPEEIAYTIQRETNKRDYIKAIAIGKHNEATCSGNLNFLMNWITAYSRHYQKRGVSDWSSPIRLVEKAVGLAPNDKKVINKLVDMYIKGGFPFEAIDFAEQKRMEMPELNKEAPFLTTLAHAYKHAGQYTEAMALAKSARREEMAAERPITLIMELYIITGKPNEALSFGESILYHPPHGFTPNKFFYITLAQAYASEGYYAEARKIVIPLIESSHRVAQIDRVLADIAIGEGDYNGALNFLRPLYYGDYAAPDRSIGTLNACCIALEETAELQQALKIAKEMCELYPGNPLALAQKTRLEELTAKEEKPTSHAQRDQPRKPWRSRGDDDAPDPPQIPRRR